MNTRHRLSIWGSALAAATFSFAAAQTSPGSSAAPLVQHSAAGIDYISGGAGAEEREAMAGRQGEFPLKVVLSAPGGEYLVAEKLSVMASQGTLLTVRDAGPIVMLKMPPGRYVLEAVYQGRTERRDVSAAASAQTLNWRFPG